MLTLAAIETNFLAWAQSQEDIRAAIVVGSQARRDHPADPYSDLDIILFVTSGDQRIHEPTWIREIGTLWLFQPGRTVAGDPELLTLFDGGVQVDFVFNPVENLAALPHMAAAGQLPDIIYRGVRVLLDKDGRIPAVPEPGPVPPARPPSADDFRGTLEGFWFNAIYCARQLCRGELFLFENASAGMTWPLLRMAEWQVRAAHGWSYDTWHAGKSVAEWVDASTYQALRDSFARCDAADGWRAMHARLELFHRLARQVAETLGFTYPEEMERNIMSCIQGLAAGR